MRAALIVGVLTTAMALAACGSSTTDTSTVASEPSTSAAPETTTPVATTSPAPAATKSSPAALSQEKAAERYLDIVRPYNEALESLEQAVNGGEPLETQTALAADTADALESEIAELRSTTWPSEIGSPVEDLIAVSEKSLEHWREAADAQTQNDLINAVMAAAEFDGGDAATAIREQLGIGPYDENDY